ncbi:MAG: hypothetical protein L6R41_007543 [Letrouitia leprolyta]|nr:MAG: hypothetical protein L6R41_007543 [Letrouitia leprolyta]
MAVTASYDILGIFKHPTNRLPIQQELLAAAANKDDSFWPADLPVKLEISDEEHRDEDDSDEEDSDEEDSDEEDSDEEDGDEEYSDDDDVSYEEPEFHIGNEKDENHNIRFPFLTTLLNVGAT